MDPRVYAMRKSGTSSRPPETGGEACRLRFGNSYTRYTGIQLKLHPRRRSLHGELIFIMNCRHSHVTYSTPNDDINLSSRKQGEAVPFVLMCSDTIFIPFCFVLPFLFVFLSCFVCVYFSIISTFPFFPFPVPRWIARAAVHPRVLALRVSLFPSFPCFLLIPVPPWNRNTRTMRKGMAGPYDR